MECLFVKGKQCPEICYQNRQSTRMGLVDLSESNSTKSQSLSDKERKEAQYLLMMGPASYNELPDQKNFACGGEAWEAIMKTWRKAHIDHVKQTVPTLEKLFRPIHLKA